ncbi:MAG: class I SAM-dependent methyltransferase [Candidatus Rokubacteria bacterium]|nr:class I SAM-dependent methyltransferase [Candidatus Rokubacteria bacterium]
MRGDAVLRVIRAYDDRVVRAYCWGRFWILRQRFLDAIGRHLPAEGPVLDVGCGFGLFSLYYAQVLPGLSLRGLDINPRRIEMARCAAARLGLSNVTYELGDAMAYHADGEYAGAYMLDIVHHIPEDAVRPLVEQLFKALAMGGRLIIKDVDTRPAYKRWFTHALDRLMDPTTPVRYWSADELEALLAEVGFRVGRQRLPDYLPYPHVLYVCERQD